MDANRSPQILTEAALTGPELQPWSVGAAVIELQELLCAHGFELKVDGNFHYITESAVKAYQKQQGLRVDGIVGTQTWAALKTTVQAGTRTLHQGDTGVDVSELQGLLRIHGYEICRDGVFGNNTRQVVIDFQKKHHLRDNGIVDAVTWTVLRGNSPLPLPPKQTGWYIDTRKWW